MAQSLAGWQLSLQQSFTERIKCIWGEKMGKGPTGIQRKMSCVTKLAVLSGTRGNESVKKIPSLCNTRLCHNWKARARMAEVTLMTLALSLESASEPTPGAWKYPERRKCSTHQFRTLAWRRFPKTTKQARHK